MRKITLLSNNAAFTLLEVLVAMVILMVGLLGMLEAINLSIATNLRNEMRTHATSVAEDQLARKKSMPFDNITTPGGARNLSVPIAMRSATMNYTVTYLVDDIPAGATEPNAKRVNIGVRWSHKGNNYEHVVSSVVTRPVTR